MGLFNKIEPFVQKNVQNRQEASFQAPRMTLNKPLSKIRSDYVFIFSNRMLLPFYSVGKQVQEVVDPMYWFSPLLLAFISVLLPCVRLRPDIDPD